MNSVRVVALVTELAAADPATCDSRGLADLVGASQQVRGWLDALDVRIALAAGRLAEQGECEAPSSLLTGGGRRAAKDAEQAARRGAVCDLLPEVHDALAEGSVRRVMPMRWPVSSRISTNAAATTSGSWRRHSSTRRRRRRSNSSAVRSANSDRSCPATTGSAATNTSAANAACAAGSTGSPACATPTSYLDPLTDAAVAAALGTAVAAEQANGADDRTLDQVKADALVGLITGTRTPDAVYRRCRC